MSTTQNRLATGKKVNSALDNPTNFFTSASLQGRASDMGALLDAMSNGIKTLEAADNGLSAITKTVESMQSTLRQARQDKSFKSDSYTVTLGTPTGAEDLEFTGGSVGTTPVAVNLTTSVNTLGGGAFTAVDFENGANNNGAISFDITANGGAVQSISITYAEANAVAADAGAVTAEELVELINTELDAAGVAATASVDTGGAIDIVSDSADGNTADVTISNFAVANGASGSGLANGSGTDAYTAKSVDTLVSEINANVSLVDKIRASNDNGKLRIENLSTADLTVTGVASATSVVNGGATTDTIGGNDVRKNLVKQFNELRDQLNKLADDASFNGVNLLRGDKLKITFNETGSSTMEIQAKDADGTATSINASNLDITSAVDADFDTDSSIDARLTTLQDSLNTLRSQSSSFGSNLSIVQNRQDFTKSMINTLQTGADNLVLADSNEEGANLLALQTRQQLSTTALSLSAQADQAVLRLF
jgi:flagellin-like hook-associated protein FlgL